MYMSWLKFSGSVRSKCRKLFVAAIDFGTTYPGYAFSATSDWSKVLTSNWTGGKVVTLKTPTALLLNSDKEFQAFGYEAEDQYLDLARDEEHEDYYFFHRFKMILHSEKASSKILICMVILTLLWIIDVLTTDMQITGVFVILFIFLTYPDLKYTITETEMD